MSADRELLTRANDEIDLPGFLAARGWHIAPDNGSRILPCFEKRQEKSRDIIISRALDGQWQWFNSQTEDGGTVVDACTRLLHLTREQMLGELRGALANPPQPLQFSWKTALSELLTQRGAGGSISEEQAKCGRPHSDESEAHVSPPAPTPAYLQIENPSDTTEPNLGISL